MIPSGWLRSELVFPKVPAASPAELIGRVSEALGRISGLDNQAIEAAFLEAASFESFSIGGGVAVPHVEFDALSETLVCLATLREPLDVRTVDGRLPDIFLFILSKPDPQTHLHLLAHIARLAQSKTFRDGLRRAGDREEILALVSAAEMRHVPVTAEERGTPGRVLVVVSISGEKAVDALLVELVDQGFGDASVLEAQSIREAAARELPLFADFRDLFGDPGGRRMLILDAPAERSGAIVLAVQRVCTECRALDARVSVLPLQNHWVLGADPAEGA